MRDTSVESSATFQLLQSHYSEARHWELRRLFEEEPTRFSNLSVDGAGLFLDYSKNKISGRTLALLCTLARERGVEAQRDAMFSGEKINRTEHRAVLHTALRAPRGERLLLDGNDINAEVHAVLDHMAAFAERVRSGAWLGYSGKVLTDIVNIGIGGSDLGPKMVCQALRPFAHPGLSFHFVSNVDGHDLGAVLNRVNAETTLFIIASKTFTTWETMLNAQTARSWFLQNGGSRDDLAKHFVAVSTNLDAVREFGISPKNMFPFWDWVGGRYSVWSAISLSVVMAIGFDRFKEFLAGAYTMDQHFREAPLDRNMPVIMALLGIWYRNFFNYTSTSIAPYHQDLKCFPSYLQQLEMESNGKRVTMDGSPLRVASCPVIWGDVGTNGQHAFFQLLHQGTDVTPVDFIAALRPSHDLPGHHSALLANCFAQSEAFMRGRTAVEVRADLHKQGLSVDEIQALIPHKIFPGNRPSNTLLMDTLTPATLGALIALYEHKTFVQGAIWGINSFDQWGVELGKVLAKTIHTELLGAPAPHEHDSSTNGLIARAKKAF